MRSSFDDSTEACRLTENPQLLLYHGKNIPKIFHGDFAQGFYGVDNPAMG
jgi:hypothetical protein